MSPSFVACESLAYVCVCDCVWVHALNSEIIFFRALLADSSCIRLPSCLCIRRS